MMKDPFRPNSNEQLIREAQIGFVIIALLLCVLVYVAFYRLSGRSHRYQEISQNIPMAQAVGDDPYYAHSIIEHEDYASEGKNQRVPGEKLFEAIAELKPPTKTAPSTLTAPVNKLAMTDRPTVDAATADPTFGIQGTFETPAVKSKTPRSFMEELPAPRSIGNSKPKPAGESLRPLSQLPPVIKSEFGVAAQEDPELSLTIAKPTKPAETTFSPVDTNEFVIEKKRDSKNLQVETTPAFEPLSVEERSSIAVASFEAEDARSDNDKVNAFQKDDVERYIVKTGDSLWTIAQEFYGDGSWFRALFEHNRVRIGEAGGVVRGFALEIPARQELSRMFPELSPVSASSDDHQSQTTSGLTTTAMTKKLDSEMEQRYHLTEDGETLFEIARQRLGQASRYLEIQQLNQFRLPEKVNHLTPLKRGVRLLLPE